MFDQKYALNIKDVQSFAVCHLASGDLWAGAEAQLYSVISVLSKNTQLKVGAIIFNKGELADRLQKLNINFKLIDEKKYSYPTQVLKTISFLKRNRFQIIHTHRYKENITSVLVCPFIYGLRIIRTQHGLIHPGRNFAGIKLKIYDALDSLVKKYVNEKIVCVSEELNQIYSRKFKKNSILIYNGISGIPPLKSLKSFNRKKTIIGAVGRLTGVKNLESFIRAAPKILKNHSNTEFFIAGDGPQRLKLEKLSCSLGLEEKIKFLGHVSDMEEIWRQMDIYVLCSKHEGLSMALLEAMSYGKLVIATKVGGNREVIVSGENGYLVRPGDSNAIADVCNMLIDMPKQHIQRITLAAYKTISGRFTSERCASSLVDLYETLSL